MEDVSTDTTEKDDMQHLVGQVFGRPWFLIRSAFSTFRHYLHACAWSDFVVAEAIAEQEPIDAEIVGDDRLQALVEFGVVVRDAVASFCPDDTFI